MIRVVAYDLGVGLDLDAAGRVLTQVEPRLVCLTSAPDPVRLRRLATSAGLEVAARCGRHDAATAVLVHPDVRVDTAASVPLRDGASTDGAGRDGSAGDEAAAVVCRVGGLRLSVTAARLPGRAEDRNVGVAALEAFLDGVDAARIVAASLDEPVGSGVLAVLTERFQDAHLVGGTGTGATRPSTDPRTRQDLVLVDRSLDVLGAFVATAVPAPLASSCLPVVADLAGRDDDATRLPVARADAARDTGDGHHPPSAPRRRPA
ncbi:hypothetical protein [Egicoccus halophilus]|uniref:Uncharacterized protein n=1 Tax=Egicoccus halophilus TaxID=1670830 RepID=A0A8J3EY68_9ACTN|nr:hypothetical protein [Egicoccus halophilus]GGI07275.1 hypothetical protein GCM10011354_23270 [Egicoccus halophilus]